MDLQSLQNGSRDRGIGRYVGSLARGLLRNAGSHDIHFILSSLFPDQVEPVITSFDGLAERGRFHIFQGVGPTAALHAPDRWRHAASHIAYEYLVASLNPDVLLIGSLFEGGADNCVVTVPRAENRSYSAIAILYDLIPLLNPDEHLGSNGARRWYFDKLEQARNADLLMAISGSARNEGIVNLPSDADHVIEIGAAAADHFADLDLDELRNGMWAKTVLSYHAIDRPYLMHVSAHDPRKNFEGLVEAYARLPLALRRAYQLVLVCRLSRQGFARLRAVMARNSLDESDVVFTGHVDDEELQVLYANCTLFVFPSFHEGFGLPVIEAMWCGAPSVGSSLSSVPEVIGRADALFDPNEIDQMVALIAKALTDSCFREDLIAHGARHARSFSWDKVAQKAIAGMTRLRTVYDGPQVRQHDIKSTIDRVAAIDYWPGPSDRDLMLLAHALDQNSQQTWPNNSQCLSEVIVELPMSPHSSIHNPV